MSWISGYRDFTVPSRATVLIYHGVPAEGLGSEIDKAGFEQHIVFLKRHFNLLHPCEVLAGPNSRPKDGILLTFDDGFRNNAEVAAPILRRHRVPALFFISSRHTIPGKYLWFRYLQMLERFLIGTRVEVLGESYEMSDIERRTSVQRFTAALLKLKPHPAAMYKIIESELPPLEDFVPPSVLNDHAAGMTIQQVRSLADDELFEVGAHTSDHPFLTQCSEAESYRQLDENKRWLEEITGRPCHAVAYPAGDYSDTVVEQCERLGFETGFAVRSAQRSRVVPRFEIDRIGIYRRALLPLVIKGVFGRHLRSMGLRLA